MSFFSGLGDLLKQYSGSGNPAGVEQHFDQAQSVPSSSIASGLAEAFRCAQSVNAIYAQHPVLIKGLGAA